MGAFTLVRGVSNAVVGDSLLLLHSVARLADMVLRLITVLGVLALAPAACTAPSVVSGSPQSPGVAQAFAESSCVAQDPGYEPALMGWSNAGRAKLHVLSKRGVVAVRYETDGCHARLELLPECVGEGKYQFHAAPARDRKVYRDAQQLFAKLPLGASRLETQVSHGRSLRTDYQLVGVRSIDTGRGYDRSRLRGRQCGAATHVVARIYEGGFAMVAGDQRWVEGAVRVFGVGVGGGSKSRFERLVQEGDPAACERARKAGTSSPRCAVPLRVGLVRLPPVRVDCPDGSHPEGDRCVRDEVITQVRCPKGTTRQGDKCVREQVVTKVRCPEGTRWDGGKCAARVDRSCAAGMHWESGVGCIADQVSHYRVTFDIRASGCDSALDIAGRACDLSAELTDQGGRLGAEAFADDHDQVQWQVPEPVVATRLERGVTLRVWDRDVARDDPVGRCTSSWTRDELDKIASEAKGVVRKLPCGSAQVTVTLRVVR